MSLPAYCQRGQTRMGTSWNGASDWA